MRRVEEVLYRRERITTPDGDFLDLDLSEIGSKKIVVIAHGLEGSSQSSYIRGMVRALNALGWDTLSWNFRGCSGEPNVTTRLYHSGVSDDLACVLAWIRQKASYSDVSLVGFSLGGNVILKYLGEKGRSAIDNIRSAVCFSVPCDLRSSAQRLACPTNRMFMKVFLRSLRAKIREKLERFPGLFSIDGLERIKDFVEFDRRFTAPIHGFRSAEEYWERCSSLPLLGRIMVPTLVVNAKDDPMLSPESFPLVEAHNNPNLFLESPDHGGHTGFCLGSAFGMFWSEERACEFLSAT